MKKGVLYIIFILLISSCGVERVYTPANYGAIKKYIAKPVYNNKDTTANYISLAVSNGKHPIREGTNDTKLIGSLNYHHSKSFKKYNFYYGLGLNYGSYKFKNALIDVIVANETQSFYSINPKIGFSFKSTRPNIDYEIIGLELNYNYENGNYQNKLNEIEPSSAIRVINEKSLFSLNIFSEILFKIDENNTIGLGLFSGGLLGLDEKKYNIEEGGGGHFSGLTFSYRFKKYIFAVVTEKPKKVKIILKDSQRIKGEFIDFNNDKIIVKKITGTLEIPISEIEKIKKGEPDWLKSFALTYVVFLGVLIYGFVELIKSL